MSKDTYATEAPVQRAFLVGIDMPGPDVRLSVEDSLIELALLADTAGLEVVGRTSQRLTQFHPKTMIGKGKVDEIKLIIEDLDADVVIFDEELSPRHQRELEEIYGENIQVIDRTALILDIFAQHARTREGSIQVELAQYEYRLPRLTRTWTHLARQAGGGGGRAGSTGGVGLRGPGETQLEVDRREIRRKIAYLKEQLEGVSEHRSRHRQQRKKARLSTVALVGYTNAGKSTLLNALSQADVLVEDKLFATLDPTTRRVSLPGGKEVLFTDTVGFIQKLPTMLVAAFRATLEEIKEADLLLHVVDITHPNARAQAESVHDTLNELGIDDIPIITALNKVDRVEDRGELLPIVDEFETATIISAQTGEGLNTLLTVIQSELYENLAEITLAVPYQDGRIVSLFHERGDVIELENREDHVFIHGRIPKVLLGMFSPFRVDGAGEDDETATESDQEPSM